MVKGSLGADGIKDKEMKETLIKNKTRKFFKVEVVGANTMMVINSRVESIIHWGAEIIKWTKQELRDEQEY